MIPVPYPKQPVEYQLVVTAASSIGLKIYGQADVVAFKPTMKMIVLPCGLKVQLGQEVLFVYVDTKTQENVRLLTWERRRGLQGLLIEANFQDSDPDNLVWLMIALNFVFQCLGVHDKVVQVLVHDLER